MENNRLRPAPQEEGSSYRSVASPLTPAPNLPLHNQSTPSSSLPAQWKSSAIPLNRREQVHRYVGHIPTYTTSKSKSRKYELIIREQPQQCRMSGFGEKDRRPIDPAPIVQLTVYEDDQPIDLKEQQYPLCILHVSLWSEDKTQQLDTVQIINRRTASHQYSSSSSAPPHTTTIPSSSSSPSSASSSSSQLMPSTSTPSNPVRTMTGTLCSSPCVLRDQHRQLGLYFSFPDIGVRVAKTYCLRFDLVILEESSQMGESVASVYSDPFVAFTVKDFPGMKESSDLAKHLSRQGLKVSVRHSVRQRKKKDDCNKKGEE